MHPVLSARPRLGLYLASWLPVGVLLAGLLGLSQERSREEALVLALPLILVFAFMGLGAWSVCRAMPLGRGQLTRVLATHGAAALTSSVFWTLVAGGWAALLGQTARFAGATSRYPGDAPVFLVVGFVLFLFSSVAHYLLLAFEVSRQAERRALELTVLAREAELKALRSQINPHFLFNSLNSINALVGTDVEAARRACQLLGDFLRQSLRLGSRNRIPLAEELGLARGYLAVEQVRFGNRLIVEDAVEPEALTCLVPPLLVQPLVENAVVHGIARVLEGGVVRITARRQAGRLEIEVENPSDPDRPPARGNGLGLANVRARLDALHAQDARLDLEETPGHFRVLVTLPAVEAPDGR